MTFDVAYTVPGRDLRSCEPVSPAAAETVRKFHSGIDTYAPTPLLSMRSLAEKLGVGQLLIKNESFRFGLNAFKGLGGSFAITSYLCRRFGITPDEHTYSLLQTPAMQEKLRDITFITATDGNHGRGVAWYANKIGCKAVVYLPAGTAKERLENIRKLGADAEITPWNYDDTVRYASRQAKENGWVLVQDTSWDGYEEIPLNVMQGYTTMGAEIADEIGEKNRKKPTHIFLQAGVGSMAGAIAGYFSSRYPEDPLRIVIVEPDKADCLFRTAKANDGKLHIVTGKLDSMMAGLSCGEPCPLAWDILKDTACAYISCSDEYSALGMRTLAKPEEGDPAVVSGESGAVTTGVLVSLMTDKALEEHKKALGLDENSSVLLISTEGDTDRDNYQKVIRGE